MTFAAYWTRLTVHRPQLADNQAKFTMTVEQFKANMLKAFNAGHAKRSAEIEAAEKLKTKPTSDIGDIFSEVFGRMGK